MKIGWSPMVYINMESMRHVFAAMELALRKRHELVYLSPEYPYSSREQQRAFAADFVRRSDVVVGRPDLNILEAREASGKHLPVLNFLFGNMPRGGFEFVDAVRYLKTTDVLVGNCAGDEEITRKFFGNANTRLLPFAFDESSFYPLGDAQRAALKAEYGFGEGDKVLLYSGRITVEKNVQTLLRLFSVIQRLMPETHLVLAGPTVSVPFQEFGLYAVNLTGTFNKIVSALRIPKERVHFLGHTPPQRMRELYNIADVLVNLTLHHDENFGYAQVEAMACGTPVVGTNWGGLKDTIAEGETGHKISTVLTPTGIKVAWFEALNRIVGLLRDAGGRRALRRRCRERAVAVYSQESYDRNLEEILGETARADKSSCQPLKPTRFAREYWCVCAPWSDPLPPYQRGPRSFQLYGELIAPYTGVSADHLGHDVPLSPEQVLFLATPLLREGKEFVEVNDLLFPFEVGVPEAHQEAAAAVLGAMVEEPVIGVGRLLQTYRLDRAETLEALSWMLEAGLLLRARGGDFAVAPSQVGVEMSAPLFSVEAVEYSTDVVLIR
ncbi:MAG: glycosyltransferase family 4 protein [Pyrinomonadaceae bacterium]